MRTLLIAKAIVTLVGIALSSTCNADFKLTVSTAHTSDINQFSLSSNGKHLASGSDDGTIRLWDVANKQMLRVLSGHSDNVTSVAIAPDGSWLASVSNDKSVKIWNAQTGAVRFSIAKPELSSGARLVISADGKTISVANCSTIYQFDSATGVELRTFGSEICQRDVARSADGRTLVGSGKRLGEGARIVKFDAASGQLVSIFGTSTSQFAEFRAVDISPDGHFIVVGDSDKPAAGAKLWEFSTGKFLGFFPHAKEVRAVKFSPDGKLMASSHIGETKIWDVASQKLVRSIASYSKAIAFLPDSKTLLIGNEKMELWSVESGQQIGVFQMQKGIQRPSIKSTDDELLAWNGDGWWTWSRKDGQLLRADKAYKSLPSFSDQSKSAVFTSRENSLVVSRNKRTLELWNIETRSLVRKFDWGGPGDFPEAVVSDDGKWIAATSSGKRAQIKVWSISDGRLRYTLPGHPEEVDDLTFSRDGQLLASASQSERNIRLWSMATGAQVGPQIVTDPTHSYPRVFDVSPDKQTTLSPQAVLRSPNSPVATWELGLWNNKTGKIIRTFRSMGGNVGYGAFSNDGRNVVSVETSRLALWETSTGRQLRTLDGNEGDVVQAMFSKDDRQITAINRDGSFRTWDVASGILLTSTFITEAGEWVTITPEGFFAASKNGTSLLYVVSGFERISIDQLYQPLYRPDLVREKLAGDPRGLVREATAQLDLAKVIASGNAPDVRIVSPTVASTSSQQIDAEAELIDRDGGIGRVEWRINGVTIGVDTPPAPAANQPVRLTRSLSLDPGSNAIEVLAYNAANLVASPPVRTTVSTLAGPVPGQPVASQSSRLFVIAAGIDDYVDSRFKLAGSVRDVRTLSQAFTTSGAGLYQSVKVRLLTDADVTTDKLDAAFKEFAAQATPADVFVLHLAGHGKTVDGRYYFVPRDFNVGNNTDEKAVNTAVVAQGIAQEQWQRWFASIPARKSMILFDTCESGSLTGDVAQTKALEQSAANDRLAQATGRSIITASSSTQLAFEYRGHGLFTYNLLDAMERADSDGNGTIEINELAAYVYAQVTQLSEQTFKKRQEPQIRIASSYPLTRQGRVLAGDLPTIAEGIAPFFQLSQTADLQIKPGPGATIVRSLNAKTPVTVIKSEGGWSLVASGGRPLGYVATRDLAPAQ